MGSSPREVTDLLADTPFPQFDDDLLAKALDFDNELPSVTGE